MIRAAILLAVVLAASRAGGWEFAPRREAPIPEASAPRAVAEPPLPAEEWTPRAALTAVRVVYGEGDRDSDAKAILWALSRRWRSTRSNGATWSFESLARHYCTPTRRELVTPEAEARALLDGDVGRLAQIRHHRWLQALRLEASRADFLARWPDADVAARELARWRHLGALVSAWGRGEVGDPCPGADQWDVPRSRRWILWPEVRCSEPTGNAFYRFVPGVPWTHAGEVVRRKPPLPRTPPPGGP